ncbi:hypothetical protein [Pseudonocardia parietis]|uniref:Uncharacterized protein n=1 Tax=Pseudonocardia parietis TaxID=570936 RepID=A0ABS4VUD0_9PSEU|nr:hypothetical protein [Pseudonocardia parietis]MBP2367530.1 hypothetical protein [Pseudonocardia parietis]
MEQFREVTEQMWSGLTAEGEAVDFAGTFGQLSELMAAELAAHRKHGADDFVTTLLSAKVDGRELDRTSAPASSSPSRWRVTRRS